MQPKTGPAVHEAPPPRPAVSAIALIAANSIPLFGVIFLGWRVFPILLIYWIENVVVGVHYGIFTTVHGAFIFAMFGEGAARHLTPSVATVSAAVRANGIGLAVLALVASHAVSFVWNCLIGGEFRNVSLGRLMVQPYERVVVLHIVIIAGGAAAAARGSPLAALVVLVGIKTTLDVAAHNRERATLGGRSMTQPP